MENCSIHEGAYDGISIITSGNMTIQDNTMYSHTRYGFGVESSGNITIDRNWITHIVDRNRSSDPTIGMAICPATICSNIKVRENIISGVHQHGVDSACFVAPSHNCGDTKQQTFRDNVAHSTTGYGARMFLNSSLISQQSECA